jgi:hypothetical protein
MSAISEAAQVGMPFADRTSCEPIAVDAGSVLARDDCCIVQLDRIWIVLERICR